MKIKKLDQHVVLEFDGMTYVSDNAWATPITATFIDYNSLKWQFLQGRPSAPMIGVYSTGVRTTEQERLIFMYDVFCFSVTHEGKNQVIEQILTKFNPTLKTAYGEITLNNIAYSDIQASVVAMFSIGVEPNRGVMAYDQVETDPGQ